MQHYQKPKMFDDDEKDRRKRNGNKSVAEDGEYVSVPWYLMDARPHPIRPISGFGAPLYDAARTPDDPFAPGAPPFNVNLDSPQGRAWAENAARQRDAWRNPPNALAYSVPSPPVASEHPLPPFRSQRDDDAASERDAAWEERGRIQRDAWRHP